jgi:hypothetical protein
MRGKIYAQPPAIRKTVDQLSRLQKAGAEGFLRIQFSQETQTALSD